MTPVTIYALTVNSMGFPQVALCYKQCTDEVYSDIARHWFRKGRIEGYNYDCILIVLDKTNECLAYSARELC